MVLNRKCDTRVRGGLDLGVRVKKNTVYMYTPVPDL